MILDEVLNEQNNIFDQEDMVDIFVEGFLYALEMQEDGKKAQSIEELSNNLIAHAANKAIQIGAKGLSKVGHGYEDAVKKKRFDENNPKNAKLNDLAMRSSKKLQQGGRITDKLNERIKKQLGRK